MSYKKIVEMIPVEKREDLSDKLLNYLLKTKNEKNMPSSMAKCFLSQWQTGSFEDETGLAVLLEATATVEPEKTIEFVEQELQLADVAKALKDAVQAGGA
ncbi:MAG TPA: hypothetical protein ENN36_09905 [Candidatus Bathyarchaeota archaeon]|nr:hypothetical protein [Candidatus Bathyarchaeota archaeon]